jgi:hypothetical protein
VAWTTASAFDTFAAKLLPTDSQKLIISSRRATIEGQLTNAFGFQSIMPIRNVQPIGSADRGTIIRPLHDLDLLAVFDAAAYNNNYRWNGSNAFITRVRNALDLGGARIIGTRGQAVRIFYQSGPVVDVAPVFALQGGGFYLPNGSNGWLTTDPDFHKRWINEQNQKLSYHLKPFARLIKRWNRVHSERLSSFHIEVMVANTFSAMGSNSRETAAKFFDWGQSRLHSDDPAGHSGDLSAKLTANQRRAVLDGFQSAQVRAERALDAEVIGDHAEAIRLWKIIFGDEFPSYG